MTDETSKADTGKTIQDTENAAIKDAKKSDGMVGLLKDIGIVVAFYLLFTTCLWGAFHIPSGSMEPTLEVGDRIFVSKFAYGYNRYSLPFDPSFVTEKRLFKSSPKRGDIAVFTLPYKNGDDFIKRVIGLPGDRIQMKHGRLYINGILVDRKPVRNVNYTTYDGHKRSVTEYEETLPGGVVHRIYEESDEEPLDNTALFVVPEGHYFMMGDNRDGSADSRRLFDMGFVKEEYLVGRASITTFSLYNCDQGKDYFCPLGIPLGRFFINLK